LQISNPFFPAIFSQVAGLEAMVPNKSTHHRFGDGGLTQAETSKVCFNESEMEAP